MPELSAFHAAVMLLMAASGLAVVLTRDPKRQALVSGLYGEIGVLLFFSLQSPDLALAALAVSTFGLPCLVLMAIAKVENEPK